MEESASSITMATARDLADLEHHEVIDGVVVRKASPTYSHGTIQGIITAQLYMGGAYARRGGGWWLSSEAEIELAEHQVYLPDVAGWRVETMPEEPEPTERTIHVRPDWVCEILSPSTARHDMGIKRAHYCAAGVGHYWIVDPFHGTLTVLRNTGRAYEVITVATADDAEVVLEPFSEIAFDLEIMFGRQNTAR
jgi:Uma2 family endonuclease